MLVTTRQEIVYYCFELFPMAPVQDVTHLRVCWNLNLTAAAAAYWTACKRKGPRTVPDGGRRVRDDEPGEGRRRLVSVLAHSPHVRLMIVRCQCLGVYSSAPVFWGAGCSPKPGLWGSGITSSSLWDFSLAKGLCKILASLYFLWDYGLIQDPRASLLFPHIF